MTVEEIRKILPQCNVDQFKVHSKQWHVHRRKFINSSELGVITGVVKYGSPIKLFYEKLGLVAPNEGNEFTFLGTYYEDSIRDLWRYHTGEAGSYMKNYEDGRKIREYIDIDCYLSNPKYPWLSGSVDGLIDYEAYHGLNLSTMSRLDGYGVLECKRISSWAARSYDGDVNPGHLLQVLSYLIITELKYGEVASMLEGGLKVDVVLPDKNVQEQILDVSRDWYLSHLVPGLKAKEKYDKAMIMDDLSMLEDAQHEMQSLEPSVDGSDDYKNYLSDTFTKDREFLQGSDELYVQARKSVTLKKVINSLEAERKVINSTISREHNRAGAEYFAFGPEKELGYTRYYTKGSNKRNELNLKVKDMPTAEFIDEQVKKLGISKWN
jgi:predicted phage-related endonuclease